MIWQGREIRRPYQVEKNRRIQGNFLRLYNEMRNLIDLYTYYFHIIFLPIYHLCQPIISEKCLTSLGNRLISSSMGFPSSSIYSVVKTTVCVSMCVHSATVEQLHIKETNRYLLGNKITKYSPTQLFTSINELELMNMIGLKPK